MTSVWVIRWILVALTAALAVALIVRGNIVIGVLLGALALTRASLFCDCVDDATCRHDQCVDEDVPTAVDHRGSASIGRRRSLRTGGRFGRNQRDLERCRGCDGLTAAPAGTSTGRCTPSSSSSGVSGCIRGPR